MSRLIADSWRIWLYCKLITPPPDVKRISSVMEIRLTNRFFGIIVEVFTRDNIANHICTNFLKFNAGTEGKMPILSHNHMVLLIYISQIGYIDGHIHLWGQLRVK